MLRALYHAAAGLRHHNPRIDSGGVGAGAVLPPASPPTHVGLPALAQRLPRPPRQPAAAAAAHPVAPAAPPSARSSIA